MCPHPKQAGCPIQTDGLNIHLAEVGGVIGIRSVRKKRATGPIETAQPALGTHPQRAGFVFVEDLHKIMGQTGGIIRVMPVVNKGIRFPIIPIKTRAVCLHSQNAGVVNVEPPDIIAAEAAFILGVVLVDLKGVPIIAIQAAQPRTKPHKSLLILDNSPYVRVREAIGNGEMGELEILTGGQRRDCLPITALGLNRWWRCPEEHQHNQG